jgi:hypothetical protein
VVAHWPIPTAADDEVQRGAIGELAQSEGVPIWSTGRREAHRWWWVMMAHPGRRWTPVRKSPGGLGGRLGAQGGAPCRRGSGGDVGEAGGRPVGAGTGVITAVEEEARRHSASTMLHGSQCLATKADAKKTLGSAPGAWCSSLLATAISVASGSRADIEARWEGSGV